MSETSYDLIALGDFRLAHGLSWALAEQLRAGAEAGYRTGIIQLKSRLVARPLPPDPAIAALLDDGAADLLDPDIGLAATLLIAQHPALFLSRPRRALRIEALHRLVLVPQTVIRARKEPLDWRMLERQAADVMGGDVAFAPIGPAVRDQMQSLAPGLRLTADDWSPVLSGERTGRLRESCSGSRAVVGLLGEPLAAVVPYGREALLAALPDHRDLDVRVLGGQEVLRRIVGPLPRAWEILPAQATSEAAFLDQIDILVQAHQDLEAAPLDPLLLQAFARGMPVILPPAFEPAFGEAALYALPEEIAPLCRRLHQDRQMYRRQSINAVGAIRQCFAAPNHTARLRELIGSPGRRTAAGPPARRKRRVLFVTINGVGMGHLTRMLAIARRCPKPLEPVFLTMSQALKVVRQMGFLAEYLPSRTYLECDNGRWNQLLHEEITELVSFYDPAVVLFDGNVPYQGFMDTIETLPEPWYIWSRRGMWRAGNPDILQREATFDAVLEPGDLAAAYDHGITAQQRERVRAVGPIRLLDPAEMLSRAEARVELGLSADRPAVLVQLGAGNNFDYRSIHKSTIAHLTRHHNAQIVVGEWLISDQPLDLPDDVKRLPGYPFARYFHAFDLAISAVGYNSFHELLFAGVPTILVPNEAMEQDNQLARAQYAERHELARCVRARDVYHLGDRIDDMLRPETQLRIKERLAALDQENGAHQAAAFIEEIAYSRRVDRD
jgi:UDP:flavonoid glycosyltransferase YjiC (YdhE family)